MRSFAIGMLVILLLILFSWRSHDTSVVFGGASIGSNAGALQRNRLYLALGIEITVSVMAGLLCAAYYEFVAMLRSRSSDVPADSQRG